MNHLKAIFGLVVLLLAGCATPPLPPTVPKANLPPLPQSVARAASQGTGQSVTLAWSPSPDSSVTGYAIYWYGSEVTNRMDVGDVLTSSVTNLQTGLTYFFYATAHDQSYVESDPSNLVSYTPTAVVRPPVDLRIIIIPQVASSLDGPWVAVDGWPSFTLTNPPGNSIYRLEIVREEVLR